MRILIMEIKAAHIKYNSLIQMTLILLKNKRILDKGKISKKQKVRGKNFKRIMSPFISQKHRKPKNSKRKTLIAK